MSSPSKRLFTIDYESQIFYYTKRQTMAGSKLKTSAPIRFVDILETALCPVQAGHGFAFVLEARGAEFKLLAESEWEAELWVSALLSARDKAQACGSCSTQDDASTEADSHSQCSGGSTPSERSPSSVPFDVLRHSADVADCDPACTFRPPPECDPHLIMPPTPAHLAGIEAAATDTPSKRIRNNAGVEPSPLSRPWWGAHCDVFDPSL